MDPYVLGDCVLVMTPFCSGRSVPREPPEAPGVRVDTQCSKIKQWRLRLVIVEQKGGVLVMDFVLLGVVRPLHDPRGHL